MKRKNSVAQNNGRSSFFHRLVSPERKICTQPAIRKIQTAMVDIKKKFGKNAIFKSADLQECATQLERNMQIGGHKSGRKE